jgi:DivIVA domain-containing protein
MTNPLDTTRYPNLAAIESKEFRLGLKGYNVDEVDRFLSALVVEVTALQTELADAQSEVARLQRKLSW